MPSTLIQLIDSVECDALQKSIVKPDAFKKAVLVQDAATPGDLFGLLLVDDARAVLVLQGPMSLQASGGPGMFKLQAFRNQIYKTGVRSQELWFCTAGTYQRQVATSAQFDMASVVEPTFPELVLRFAAWRSGKANW